MRAHDGDRLRCGAQIDDLIAQAAAGRAADLTPHQQGCAYCRAALAEYDRLWAPVRDLADQPVAPPDSIVQAALRRIRRVTQTPRYGQLADAEGLTLIADRVVKITARVSAEHVPGVRAALSRELDLSPQRADVSAEPTAGVVAGVAGRSTVIEITVAADYGQELHSLAQRIRTAVGGTVRSVTGLDPVEVTVVIDDVLR